MCVLFYNIAEDDLCTLSWCTFIMQLREKECCIKHWKWGQQQEEEEKIKGDKTLTRFLEVSKIFQYSYLCLYVHSFIKECKHKVFSMLSAIF